MIFRRFHQNQSFLWITLLIELKNNAQRLTARVLYLQGPKTKQIQNPL